MCAELLSALCIAVQDDSIEGIYSTLKRCAQISKAAGGVGLSVSNIRASGSYIRGTNGQSNGLLPMLRVYNNTARFVNQGGGKRQGLPPISHPAFFSCFGNASASAHSERKLT